MRAARHPFSDGGQALEGRFRRWALAYQLVIPDQPPLEARHRMWTWVVLALAMLIAAQFVIITLCVGCSVPPQHCDVAELAGPTGGRITQPMDSHPDELLEASNDNRSPACQIRVSHLNRASAVLSVCYCEHKTLDDQLDGVTEGQCACTRVTGADDAFIADVTTVGGHGVKLIHEP